MFKNITINNNKKYLNLGFTLVETLVSVTLFTFVSFVSISALFQMQALNTKLKVSKNIYNNIYFTNDIITNEIRQGSNFENKDYYTNPASPIDCNSTVGDDSCIVFDYLNVGVNNSSERRGYYLNSDNRLVRYNVSGSTVSQDTITSENLNIETLKFILQGTSTYSFNGDTQQPSIKIIIKGNTTNDPQTPFYTEGIITQRPSTN
jgi:type II secretory pathway component PulJ